MNKKDRELKLNFAVSIDKDKSDDLTEKNLEDLKRKYMENEVYKQQEKLKIIKSNKI